jgi:membrane-bound lytic murein transglycosylase A
MENRLVAPWGVCVLVVLWMLGAAACSSTDEAQAPVEKTLNLRPMVFEELSGWGRDGVGRALEAFQRSCTKLLARDPGDRMVADRPVYGTVRDWQPACYRAQDLEARGDTSRAAAEQFFRTFFQPYRIAMGGRAEGLFTGYYEPQLQGARQPTTRYSEPLHRPPDDLIRVRLGRFRSSMENESIFGRVDDGELVPYYTRAEIEGGVLQGRGLELLWVDDAVDKFFLQIQGSGRVVLRDSSLVRVGYAAENGRPYRAIGRDLIAMGAVSREEMSMQAIRTWLDENPDRAQSLMNRNRSYVFFEIRQNLDATEGPIGAQGVPLTAEHSLAVDPRYVPYGAPLWLTTHRPVVVPEVPTDTIEGVPTRPFRHLMIAQDTGGAIRGAVRGDVFWGAGDRAANVAGRMKSPGTYAVLIPRTLTR